VPIRHTLCYLESGIFHLGRREKREGEGRPRHRVRRDRSSLDKVTCWTFLNTRINNDIAVNGSSSFSVTIMYTSCQFVEDDRLIGLKTIIPSRKVTKQFLDREPDDHET
jgi:hypothetical protein